MNTSKISLFNTLFRPDLRPLLMVAFCCLLASGVFGFLSPRMILELGQTYGEEEFYQSISSLIFLFFGIYINQVLYQLILNKYIQHIVIQTRTDCYEKWILYHDIQTQRDSIGEDYPQGEVLARIVNDTESVRELMTSGTFGIILNAFFIMTSLVSFVAINERLGLFLAVFLLTSSIALFWSSRYIREIFHAVRKARGIVQRELANLIGGVKETYYTNHGQYAQKRGQIVFENFLKKMLQSNIWDASYYSCAESLYPMMLLFVVLVFPHSGLIDAAIILATVDIIQKSINPIKDIASKIANVQRAITGVKRINEFLGDIAKGHSSPLEVQTKDISFDKLSVHIKQFSYPSYGKEKQSEHPFSLQNIAFEGKKGQLYGIVGLSGHGKSTLLNILSGNIVPDDFNIVVHTSDGPIPYGHKYRGKENHYREHVGLVSQDSHVFSESLKFNITLGQRTPEEFELFWKKICKGIPYLRDWEKKLDKKILPGELSAGQRQLVSAVRSCFLKKKIILFDEISSGLDGELEEALRETIKIFQTLGFVMVVAHRIETILDSHMILVMEEGKIAAMGIHGELQKTSAIYNKFLQELGHKKDFDK